MSKMSSLTMQAFASVLILFLSACAEDPLDGKGQTGKGHTVTLHIAARVAPIPETKATVAPARSGSEAEAVGFYYEMVSSDAERAVTTPGFGLEILPTEKDYSEINFSPKELAAKAEATKALSTKALETKAPKALKNAYALLFTSTGAFNGHASIGAFSVESPQDITFTEVDNPKADGCRLLIVANDDVAVTSYASTKGTGGFADFTGTYAEFQKLTITSGISRDEDVPYAGCATVDLSQSEIGVTAEVPLFRTLAKITLNNEIFDITGGPARSSIILYNAGERRFATPGNDSYEGTGLTETTAFVPSTNGGNTNSTTWYVGENIRPAGKDIHSAADRNSAKAPANACYIEIKSASMAVPENTSPAIGEEYIPKGGGKTFTYEIYLGRSADVSDFSLRRHTNYTITSEIDGTLNSQKQLAAEDGRVAFSGDAGLAIGPYGGPANYSIGTGSTTMITGSYTTLLLLEPNTSRTTAIDNITKGWGAEGIQYQTETRKYWDRTYNYNIKTGGTIGGMNAATDGLYAYCNDLTLGDVPKGSWYVPAQAQLAMIWAIYGGMKEGGFEGYTAFYPFTYWSSTESSATSAWYVGFNQGYVDNRSKTNLYNVRCVRDLSVSDLTGQKVITNHPSAIGYPVIDLTELSPLGCLLTTTEAATRRTQINEQAPSNTAILKVGLEVSAAYGTWNTKMSSQFQVMCADHTVGGTDWANAYNLCKQYKDEGGSAGQWRLPTQRELIAIWGVHSELLGKGSFTAFNANRYWSSTEYNADEVWSLSFSNGAMGYVRRVNTYNVRCVRDL